MRINLSITLYGTQNAEAVGKKGFLLRRDAQWRLQQMSTVNAGVSFPTFELHGQHGGFPWSRAPDLTPNS